MKCGVKKSKSRERGVTPAGHLLNGGGVPQPCGNPCGGGNPPGGVETMYEVNGGGGGGAPLPGGGGPYPPRKLRETNN